LPRKPSFKRFLAAVESGDITLVERLIANGADVHGEYWRESPDSCAIRCGHVHIVALLIRHGIDPREYDDTLFSLAVANNRPDVLKLLATTVFAPDLWPGKTLLDIQEQADLIYRNIQKDLPEEVDEAFRLARLALFDAAMTCWEHVRPDPPKIKISDVPAKGRAL
jgi:hypothetical protein